MNSSLCAMAEAVYDVLLTAAGITYDTTMKGCFPGAVASCSRRVLDHIQSLRFTHKTQGSTKEVQELHNQKKSEINPHGARSAEEGPHINVRESTQSRKPQVNCDHVHNRAD